ncbi:hypothetical protein MMC19_005280 [Ptychographa xylographoides]|nr:hypothetical protein [Ptychographa xylographoides]
MTSAFSGFEAPPPTREEDLSAMMRTYKPRTPGVRHLKRPINDHLWKGRAHLPLTYPRKGHGIGGRNNSGRIMVRHRGGGHKRRIRVVDFTRMEAGKHKVERIEHDPGRSAHIALLTNEATQDKSYIVAAEGMRAGDVVQSYRRGIPQDLLKSMGGIMDPAMIAAKTAWRGNCLPLHMIPPGALVYNIGLRPGMHGQLCRSAGTFGQLVGSSDTNRQSADDTQRQKKSIYVNIKLQSGEVRKIHRLACATIGVASNANYNRRQLGKAGRSRWLGIRPTVRGVAMNACDHPHGGGRGKSKGNVIPISVWGRTPVSNFLHLRRSDPACREPANFRRPKAATKLERSPTSTRPWWCLVSVTKGGDDGINREADRDVDRI